jgi:regulatory protein
VQDVTPVVLLRGELGPGIPDQPQAGWPASLRSAYRRALDALARRPRSVMEIRRWLADRHCSSSDIAEVVHRLVGNGLLDDVAFAESFARSRLMDRKLGRRRVLMELSRRGVDPRIGQAAIESVAAAEGQDEMLAAMAVAARKCGSLRSLDAQKQRRRLTAFLVRRGYPVAVVTQVVRDTLAR